MLGSCLIRTPITKDLKADVGAICEALLFFNQTHVILDHGSLGAFFLDGFIDDFIEMLERQHLTANYTPEIPILISESKGGLLEYRFEMARFGGDKETGFLKRAPDALFFQLKRLCNDEQKAKHYHQRLCKLISFKALDAFSVVRKAVDDLTDPLFAGKIAKMSLERLGVPSSEISFSRLFVFSLDNGRFAVDTDINFNALKKFTPQVNTLGVNNLFSGMGGARLDIALAARRNAAFVGNVADQSIIEMVLRKTFGEVDDKMAAAREIYDFIALDTPSVREVINSGERSAREFMDLLKRADGFKQWLSRQNPDKDLVREMLREKSKQGWLDSIPVRAARFGLFTGGGFFADLVSPGVGVALGAVDSFLVDQLAKRWRPHFFVENALRGFLDREH